MKTIHDKRVEAAARVLAGYGAAWVVVPEHIKEMHRAEARAALVAADAVVTEEAHDGKEKNDDTE